MKYQNTRHLLVLVALAGVFAFAMMLVPLTTPHVQAASVAIDHFDDNQTVAQTGVGTTYQDAAFAGIIGGHRNVTVTVTSGSLQAAFNSNSPATHGAVSNGANVSSIITLTYDGNATAGVNPTGLGTRDLTSGGLNSAVVMKLDAADFAANVTVRIWSDANHCSEDTISPSLPAGGIQSLTPPTNSPPMALVFRFKSMVTCAGFANGANFASVGAIQTVIDAPLVNTDLIFDQLEGNATDYGDLPDGSTTPTGPYQTRYGNNGAVHVISGTLRLGVNIDGEDNGQPSTGATGDDLNALGGTGVISYPVGDEDGIKRTSTPWTIGATGGSLDVTVSGGSGCLMGWIDWSGTGFNTTAGSPDIIFNNVLLTAGTHTLTFNVPATFTTTAAYYARFRLYPLDVEGDCHTTIHKDPSGSGTQAYGGEVEDYRFGSGVSTAVQLSAMTAQSENMPALPIATGTLVFATLLGAVVITRRRK